MDIIQDGNRDFYMTFGSNISIVNSELFKKMNRRIFS